MTQQLNRKPLHRAKDLIYIIPVFSSELDGLCVSQGENEGQHVTCGRAVIGMARGRGGREGKNTY